MTSRRTADLLVVALGGGILVLASFLAWSPSIFGIDLMPRQSFCWSRLLFGALCPGCGLTRSFVAIAGGSLSDAWRFNRMGPFLFGGLVTLVALHGARLAGAALPLRWLDALLASLLVAALLGHTLIFYFGGP